MSRVLESGVLVGRRLNLSREYDSSSQIIIIHDNSPEFQRALVMEGEGRCFLSNYRWGCATFDSFNEGEVN